jgi:hypothetical protein
MGTAIGTSQGCIEHPWMIGMFKTKPKLRIGDGGEVRGGWGGREVRGERVSGCGWY